MKKIFTILVVLFPILSVYATPIAKLSVADLLLILIFPIVMFDFLRRKHNIITNVLPVLLFAYYIIITLFIQIVIGSDVGILSTIRYILYLVFLLFSFRYFVFKFAINFLGKITLCISGYVIIQFLTYILFSVTLPWYFPGLEVVDENFVLKGQTDYYLTFYRPTGVFMEPTHFAQFCVVYLVYLLFYNIKNKTSLIKATIVSTAVIVSGSSLGLIFLVFVWCVWFMKKQIYKFEPFKILLLIFLLLITIQTLFSVEYFQNIITRMITDNGFNGAAVGYRFNSLSMFNDKNISIVNWLFGSGRSSEEAYYTGIFYFLNANGIIGVLLYFWICIDAAFRSKEFGRWLIITVFILSIGSEFICNFGILFYISFIYSRGNDNGNVENLENNLIESLKVKTLRT